MTSEKYESESQIPLAKGEPSLLGFPPFSHHDDEDDDHAGLIISPHRPRYFTALSVYSLAFTSSDRSSSAVSVGHLSSRVLPPRPCGRSGLPSTDDRLFRVFRTDQAVSACHQTVAYPLVVLSRSSKPSETVFTSYWLEVFPIDACPCFRLAMSSGTQHTSL